MSSAAATQVAAGVLDALPADASGALVWRALGQAGLTGPVYRDGTVAAGVRPDRLGQLLAAVDARFPVGTTLAVCVQLATALPVLAGGDGPAARVLRQALAGEAVVALAATDDGTGSDLTALTTRVQRNDGDSDGDGDGALDVTGGKRWITNATTADVFLVLARHRPGRHFTNFTWVLVPASAPGVTVTPADADLFAGSGVGHVSFDRVRLPAGHLVGRPGRGLPSFARHIGTERLAGALWAVALGRRALAATRRGLATRRHGDGVLWDLDAVRQRFAACLVDLRQLDSLARELGDRIARRHDTAAAALLKAAAGRTVQHVLAECAQLQGAAGFTAGGARTLGAQAGIFAVGGGVTEVVLAAVAGDADAWLAELDPASRT